MVIAQLAPEHSQEEVAVDLLRGTAGIIRTAVPIAQPQCSCAGEHREGRAGPEINSAVEALHREVLLDQQGSLVKGCSGVTEAETEPRDRPVAEPATVGRGGPGGRNLRRQ